MSKRSQQNIVIMLLISFIIAFFFVIGVKMGEKKAIESIVAVSSCENGDFFVETEDGTLWEYGTN